MVRTSPSPADRRLIDLAAQRGAEVSARHLERWRSRPSPLLPSHRRDYPGRPTGGSSSMADDRLVDLVVWLARNRRPGTDRGHLALRAFGAGLPVPEETVQDAFVRAARGVEDELRRGFGELPEDGDLQEWVYDGADALAGSRQRRPTAVDRRIGAIDRQVQALVEPAAAEFAARFDPGAAEAESLDRNDRQFHAAVAAMAGPGELTPDTLARYARGLVGNGMPQWTAHLLETDPRDPLAAVAEAPKHQAPGLPAHSAANHLLSVARDAPLERLHTAWTAAAQMPGWAENTCAAVESELAAGQPAKATERWAIDMVVPFDRLFLADALSDPDPAPGTQALTALNLLFMTDAINTTLAITDDDGRETIRRLAPPFFLSLVTVE
ncbi:hypothetical protein ABZW10_31410 [Kitasatospora sp. NPDC004723]|uniref:hypothetical protein n=1 Tax=Kitasatospora sp. NPDC004723 TaxID=3154288 RepID=UPI0033B7F960